MKQPYRIQLGGMTCHACESLITMDLTDAGMPPSSIHHETGELLIELEPDQLERLKKVITDTDKYEILSIELV